MAQVAPMAEINLHFTGDFHAITAANNLLAAMAGQPYFTGGNALGIEPRRVTWRRAMDMNDRALRTIVTQPGGQHARRQPARCGKTISTSPSRPR